MNTINIPASRAAAITATFKSPRFNPEKRPSLIVLCMILWSVLSYLIVSHFIVMGVQIKGISMSPTLLDGQHYLLYRFPYLFHEPKIGEIVVLRDPEDYGLSIKRIVAVPNDTVEIKADGVYVNNAKLPETYLTAASALAAGHKIVPRIVLSPEEYYVMGDNRDWSADSRSYGPLLRGAILGKISRDQ